MIKSPVLLLIFNRPDTTKMIFEQIRKVKPPKLFVAADGPRAGATDEKKNCELAREIIRDVDWKCEIHTLFRDANLGCKLAVSGGISWFFKNVEEGIIIEDDCYADVSFFCLCDYLLEKYRNENKVMMIAGTSYLPEGFTSQYSYFFTRYYSIWGWATWRRAWNLYDIKMANWEVFRRKNQLSSIFFDKKITEFYTDLFDRVDAGKFDTWDIQWAYSCIFNNGLSISPIKNLVRNIATTGTHQDGESIFLNRTIFPIDLNTIKDPEDITPDTLLDNASIQSAISQEFNLASIVKRKVRKILRKLKS